MQFLCSIWKILHLTEYFYTGTAHGTRNNYQVWPRSRLWTAEEEDFALVDRAFSQHFHNKEIFKMQRDLCKYVSHFQNVRLCSLVLSIVFPKNILYQEVSLSFSQPVEKIAEKWVEKILKCVKRGMSSFLQPPVNDKVGKLAEAAILLISSSEEGQIWNPLQNRQIWQGSW